MKYMGFKGSNLDPVRTWGELVTMALVNCPMYLNVGPKSRIGLALTERLLGDTLIDSTLPRMEVLSMV